MAPLANASATQEWPSRSSPGSARNRSPGQTARESAQIPRTGASMKGVAPTISRNAEVIAARFAVLMLIVFEEVIVANDPRDEDEIGHRTRRMVACRRTFSRHTRWAWGVKGHAFVSLGRSNVCHRNFSADASSCLDARWRFVVAGRPVDDCMLARFSTIRKRYRPARSAVARPLHS